MGFPAGAAAAAVASFPAEQIEEDEEPGETDLQWYSREELERERMAETITSDTDVHFDVATSVRMIWLAIY